MDNKTPWDEQEDDNGVKDKENLVNLETGLGDDTKRLAYKYLLKGVGQHSVRGIIKDVTHVVVKEFHDNAPDRKDNWIAVEFYENGILKFHYDFEIKCCGHGGQPINLDVFRKKKK